MTNRPKVSFIIPVLHFKRPLNKARFFMPRYTLPDVLKDIAANVTVPYEVVVICNGQDRELVDFVRTNQTINKYCLNSVNVGVARSWNMGAEMAEGELLCYLNDDVAIGKDSIEQLCALFDDPEVGEVGPAGSYWENLQHHSYPEGGQVTETDCISGFCFLVRDETFRKVGGFDVGFTPAGYEEIDFSFRVRKAGMKCMILPTVDIKHYHHHGVSSQKVEIAYLNSKIDTEALHQKNRDYFFKKWSDGFPSVRNKNV